MYVCNVLFPGKDQFISDFFVLNPPKDPEAVGKHYNSPKCKEEGNPVPLGIPNLIEKQNA
jgi:hypothetical protein